MAGATPPSVPTVFNLTGGLCVYDPVTGDALPPPGVFCNSTCHLLLCPDCFGTILCQLYPPMISYLSGVIVSSLAAWFVLSRVDFKISRVPFWLASQSWSRGIGKTVAPLLSVALQLLLLCPWIFSIRLGIHLYDGLRPFYEFNRTPMLAASAAACLLGSVFSLAFAYSQWKFNNWMCTNVIKVALGFALVSFFSIYVSYYLFVYYNTTDMSTYVPGREDDVEGHLFTGATACFLTLNLIPTVIATYLKADTGVPVDYSRFLKDSRKYDPLDYRLQIANAGDERVNGTYVASKSHVSDGVPIYVKQPSRATKAELLRIAAGGKAGGGGWGSKSRMGAATAAGDDPPADVDPNAVAVMRVRMFDSPFWVIAVGPKPIYGLRSPFHGPPGGQWQTINDAPMPRPIVVPEDNFIHEVNDAAHEEAARKSKFRQRLIGVLYMLSLLTLVLYSVWTWQNKVFKELNIERLGPLVSAVILYCEFAQVLRLLSNIKYSPVGATVANVMTRAALVAAGKEYIFLAACFCYIVFAIPAGVSIADAMYPTDTPEDVLREQLKHLLPKWMYSSGGGGGGAGASSGGDGGNMMSAQVLGKLFANPLDLGGKLCKCTERCCKSQAQKVVKLGKAPSKGWRMATATLFYLSFCFGIFVYVAYHFRTTCKYPYPHDPSHADPPCHVSTSFPDIPVRGMRFPPYEVGVASIAIVWIVVAILSYLRAYRYYGHTLNKLPRWAVARLGIMAVVVSSTVVVVVFYLVGKHDLCYINLQGVRECHETMQWYILIIGLTMAPVIIAGHWTVNNWEANDYLILRAKATKFNLRAPKINALRGFLPDLSSRQLRKDSGVLIGGAVVELMLVTMGELLAEAGIQLSHLEYPHRHNGWLICLGVNLVIFTWLGLKAYFNTFRKPVYVGVVCYTILFLIANTFSNSSTLSKYSTEVYAACLAGYPTVVLICATFYQWYDNEWKLDWKKTKLVLYILTFSGFVVYIVAIFVAGFINIVPVGTLVNSTVSNGTVVEPTVFTQGKKDAAITLDLYGGHFYVWTLFVGIRWATRNFRLPSRIKRFTSFLAVGFLAIFMWFCIEFGVRKRTTLAVGLTFVGVAIFLNAVTGLRAPSTKIVRHFHKYVFPVNSLNTVTGSLNQANSGAFFLFGGCLFLMWWGMLSTLLSDATESHRPAVAATVVGLITIVTFRLHMRSMPGVKYHSAWSLMRHHPDQLYTIRSKVLEADGVDTSAPTASADKSAGKGGGGGASGGGGAGAEESKSTASSAKGGGDGHGGDEEDGDDEIADGPVSTDMLKRLAPVVPESYPPIIPLPCFKNVNLSKLDQAFDVERLASGKLTFGAASPYPSHYIVTTGCPVVSGVYVRHGKSDGVPQYVQHGKGMTMFLKRVKIWGGTFWVIAQPNLFLYGCRVDAEAKDTKKKGRNRGSIGGNVFGFVTGAVKSGLAAAEAGVKGASKLVEGVPGGGLLSGVVGGSKQVLGKHDLPPREGYSIIGDYDGTPPLVQKPQLETWDELVSAQKALLSYKNTMKSLYRQECRRVARFCIMLDLAAQEQQAREGRVVWTFVLQCIAATAKANPAETGQRLRAVSLTLIGDESAPGGARGGGLGSLSPHEVLKWVKRHKRTGELQYLAKNYALEELTRRTQQRLEHEQELEMSRRQKAQAKQYTHQFAVESALEALGDNGPEDIDRVFTKEVAIEIQNIVRQKGGAKFTDPRNPKFEGAPVIPARKMRYENAVARQEPQLYLGDPAAKDIQQGALGDCWLLSAMGILAGSRRGPAAVRDVIISHNREYGFYVVKLYRAEEGEWVRVVVDDNFPVDKTSGGPLLGHSPKPVTWVMVLEKAMAKFFNSDAGYDVLDAGLVHDGLVAFTGGASEEIDLRDSAQVGSVTVLWQRMRHYNDQGFMLGAASPPGDDHGEPVNGIVQGHAYAILGMQEVALNGKTYRMIRVRNPWGDNPEPGPSPLDWMPGSSLWENRGGEYMMRKLEYNPADDPGEFWMTFEDFAQQYSSVFVCRLLDKWDKVAADGQWYGGRSFCAGGLVTGATGHNNPQYLLTVERATSVFVTLTQAMTADATSFPHIMCVLFRRPEGTPIDHGLDADIVHDKGFFKTGEARDQREVSMEIAAIPAGTYLIIPMTFYPDTEGIFKVRVYFPQSAKGRACSIKQLFPEPDELEIEVLDGDGGGGGGGDSGGGGAAAAAGSGRSRSGKGRRGGGRAADDGKDMIMMNPLSDA